MTLTPPTHSETPRPAMNTNLSDTHAAPTAVNPAARGRILLVDDEPVLRAMASTVLIAQGWEVLNASSAEEAAEPVQHPGVEQMFGDFRDGRYVLRNPLRN